MQITLDVNNHVANNQTRCWRGKNKNDKFILEYQVISLQFVAFMH